jgi:hypothetical protein
MWGNFLQRGNQKIKSTLENSIEINFTYIPFKGGWNWLGYCPPIGFGTCIVESSRCIVHGSIVVVEITNIICTLLGKSC